MEKVVKALHKHGPDPIVFIVSWFLFCAVFPISHENVLFALIFVLFLLMYSWLRQKTENHLRAMADLKFNGTLTSTRQTRQTHRLDAGAEQPMLPLNSGRRQTKVK